MKDLHKELYEESLINEEQFSFLDLLRKRKVISLYYELQLLLYLGIMLFTGGVGYIVYQNLSDIGHIALMALLGICIVVGGYYISIKSKPYANEKVDVDHFYFDYVIVLVSLLIISLFTYIQVYFELLEILLTWTSVISGILFLFIAYRYDNKMVLSMGITALAASIGLTVSPVDWVNGNWLEGIDVYIISIVYGFVLLGTGHLLSIQNIKKHFTFTYHNFGLILIYLGGLTLMFDFTHIEQWIATSLLLFSIVHGRLSWKNKSFLFFLYASIVAYITFTFLFFSIGINEELWLWYLPISFFGGVYFLVKKRAHFAKD